MQNEDLVFALKHTLWSAAATVIALVQPFDLIMIVGVVLGGISTLAGLFLILRHAVEYILDNLSQKQRLLGNALVWLASTSGLGYFVYDPLFLQVEDWLGLFNWLQLILLLVFCYFLFRFVIETHLRYPVWLFFSVTVVILYLCYRSEASGIISSPEATIYFLVWVFSTHTAMAFGLLRLRSIRSR